MSEITKEQFDALEAIHGKNHVLILSIGEDEFAFRRPSEVDVDFALDEKERGSVEWMENALIGCVLCPSVPTANKAKKEKTEPTGPCPELAAIRAQIHAIWASAPLCRDTLPLAWFQSCGWNQSIDSKPLGQGKYEVRSASNTDLGAEEWTYSLTVRILTSVEYNHLRKLQLQEGVSAERFAFSKCVTLIRPVLSSDPEVLGDAMAPSDFAALYPTAVIGIGRLVRSLGAESRSVSVKKFGAGSAQQPTTSTEKPLEG